MLESFIDPVVVNVGTVPIYRSILCFYNDHLYMCTCGTASSKWHIPKQKYHLLMVAGVPRVHQQQ